MMKTMNNSNFEIRYADITTANEESRTIEGTAIVFNKESVLLGGEYREIILPDACTQKWLDSQDVRVLYNHNMDGLSLARHKSDGTGTLELRVETDGVHFKFDAPNTPFGTEILDAVRRGDADRMSFAFRVPDGGDKWQKRGTEYLRTVTKFDRIREISILDVNAAYSSTSVACRSLEEFKKTEVRDDEPEPKSEDEKIDEGKQKADEEEKQRQELKDYYDNLKKDFQ